MRGDLPNRIADPAPQIYIVQMRFSNGGGSYFCAREATSCNKTESASKWVSLVVLLRCAVAVAFSPEVTSTPQHTRIYKVRIEGEKMWVYIYMSFRGNRVVVVPHAATALCLTRCKTICGDLEPAFTDRALNSRGQGGHTKENGMWNLKRLGDVSFLCA